MLRPAPYETVLKPYGTALLDLALQRDDIVCLGADLTRQTETDLFRDQIPERFFNAGMAEANLMGMAAGLARSGLKPFVNTFGVFATRRPFDQVAMSIAYPNLPVRLVGFMPGLSSPGGPSHQAIDDVSLMRVLPNMTVIDVADAGEVSAVVGQIVDLPGPVYLRLKRGEIPVMFDDTYSLSLSHATVIRPGGDVLIVASGMMLAPAVKAAEVAAEAGVEVGLVYVPVIKPLDSATIIEAVSEARGVITAENHSVIGGLGSAVAEVMAEAGSGVPLRRIGVQDTYASAGSRPYLFREYGLSSRNLLEVIWDLSGTDLPIPDIAEVSVETPGVHEPV
ncbi:MAG: transketolase C-terminal domain-containing protein [Acidimicrobiia bacterium]